MRWWLLLLTGLLVGVSACEKPSTPPAVAPPVSAADKPAVASPAAAEPETPLPLPTTGRRERAGIDLADGDGDIPSKALAKDDAAPAEKPGGTQEPPKARVPAAEFIVTAPAATAPEVSTGPRGSSAVAALKWVRDVWAVAAVRGDVDAYVALLHANFKGRRPEHPEPTLRAGWGEVRVPKVGTPVTWGLEEVVANPGVTGAVSIQMVEAQGSGPDCRFGTRALTLQPAAPDGTGPWLVMAEERSKEGTCATVTVRDIVGVHSGLGSAWKSRDLSAVKGAIHGGFTLLDGGVEAERYNMAALTTGPGRWVLDQLAASTATATNTRLVGDSAIVSTAAGERFGYRLTGGAWRLVALWRPKR